MRRPRLRTLLLLVNLVILVLPLAGIWFLRLYESALIRQTESELIAQAAVLAGAFKAERQRLLAAGAAPAEPVAGARPAAPEALREAILAAGLDLATDPVLPPPADPPPPTLTALPLAAAVGRALAPVLRDTQAATLAALRLTDRQGVIVATTGDDLGRRLDPTERPEIDRALAGTLGSVLRLRARDTLAGPASISRGSSLRVFVALPVIDGGQVVGSVMLSRTPRDLVQAMWGKRWHLLGLGVLLLAVAVTTALLSSRLITRPLARLVDRAQAVATAGGPVPPEPDAGGPGTREVEALSAALGRMATTLAQRADYIRSFAAHVSHEFKTPLAGAKGALELLTDHHDTMTQAERRHFLETVANSLDRLERLVRRLLDLARADMMRPGSVPPAPLGPVLERVAARYRALGLDVRVQAEEIALRMPEDAIEIVVASLLDNARQHAGPRATVRIEAHATPHGTILTVADDGPGVAPGDASRVFEPFFTTARAAGGTGLGLPIVQAVVTGAGGTVALLPGGGGATFRITLPPG